MNSLWLPLHYLIPSLLKGPLNLYSPCLSLVKWLCLSTNDAPKPLLYAGVRLRSIAADKPRKMPLCVSLKCFRTIF